MKNINTKDLVDITAIKNRSYYPAAFKNMVIKEASKVTAETRVKLAKSFNIHTTTINRWLKEAKLNRPAPKGLAKYQKNMRAKKEKSKTTVKDYGDSFIVKYDGNSYLISKVDNKCNQNLKVENNDWHISGDDSKNTKKSSKNIKFTYDSRYYKRHN